MKKVNKLSAHLTIIRYIWRLGRTAEGHQSIDLVEWDWPTYASLEHLNQISSRILRHFTTDTGPIKHIPHYEQS